MVLTHHGKTDLFQVGKGMWEICILSLYLFNINAEYIILREAWLEEEHCFKVGGRNISNLCYADDITLIAKTAKDLQTLIIKAKKYSEKSN